VIALLAVPAAAAAGSLWLPPRAAALASAASGISCLALAAGLVPAAVRGGLAGPGPLRLDALSVIFLLATAFGYACAAAYSVGYLSTAGGHGLARPGRQHWYWAGLNLFACSMLAAPLMGNLALMWVAVEVTTIVSALLVALEGTAAAAEAAWKYVLLASSGLAIALLGTMFAYYAGARALGPGYDLAFAPLLHASAHLPATAARLAFVLAVLGYGTKVGLVPVHTWLPDAHSEAPSPVSALLSGSLLAVSFYAILRFFQIAQGALGPRFPRDVLLAFGVASLLLAALYLLDQRDVKRMLAYSSVEHMGILAVGTGFGAPVALAGVLLHVLAHAAAKGNAFLGAGVLARAFGTKRIPSLRGALDALPWSGPMFLLALGALGALPPFGMFRSEFEIVAGGFESGATAAAALLVVLLTLAFLGLSAAGTALLPPGTSGAARGAPDRAAPGRPGAARARMANGAAGASAGPEPALSRGEPSAWMVVPVLAGLVVLLVLGVHPPAELQGLLSRAVDLLRGAA